MIDSLYISSPTNFILIQLHTEKPAYYGYLGTNNKYPDYQGVPISLYENVTFGTLTECVDNKVSLFSSVHSNRFHCICTWYKILIGKVLTNLVNGQLLLKYS